MNCINPNGIAALKGNQNQDIELLKSVFEDRLDSDFFIESEKDFTLLSSSENIRQGELLIGFNGYLETKEENPERALAEAYRKHGENFAGELGGSFRAVLYDSEKDRVYTFSDKTGRKVMYYTEETEDFICSSHLTPLLRHSEVEPNLDRQGVSEFLQSWSVSFGGEERLIEGVKRLEPSHQLTYSNGEIVKSKFWEIYDRKRQVSDEEAVRKMDSLLREAAENLVGKVDDINIFLSGGFDSVFLTRLLSEVTDKRINTYTWGWKDKHFEDAERMSDKLGTRQHSIKLDYKLPTESDVWFYEEPQNAFVRYPFRELYEDHGMRSYWTGLNSQATFPVCLKNIRKLDRTRKLHPLIRRMDSRVLRNFIGENISYKLSKALAVIESDNYSAGAVNDWGLRQDQAQKIISEELRDTTENIGDKLDDKWNLREKSYQENYSYLQFRARDTARYAYYAQDMGHMDVFGYTPLLKYSYSLPMSQKKNRRLLQKIAEGRVPDRIITKGASGWEFVSEQFRRKIVNNRQEYVETIESFLERGFLKPRRARRVLLPDDYSNLTKGPVNQMIAVYMLEKWIQVFIERDKPWEEP